MTHHLIHGSAHDIPIADKSVHCLVTSPPYYGLRKYSGDQGVDWPAVDYSPMAGLPPVHVEAMRCDLGLEPDPFAYIGHLILCLREWYRILRDDGTCWVNLGSSYANKQDQIIPARFALAAQADGWFLRSAVVWAKGVSFIPHYAGSCMPESALDRPTQSYEMVYMLAKQERYYFDMEAVKEPAIQGEKFHGAYGKPGVIQADTKSRNGREDPDNSTSNRHIRSVWAISPRGYQKAHFATWPEALVTPMIKASTSAHGCCKKCGSPWRRVVERTGGDTENGNRPKAIGHGGYGSSASTLSLSGNGSKEWTERGSKHQTTGWTPACQCDCDEVAPATIIDPFVGSGTTIRAAMKLGRSAIGVDISDAYLGDLVPERTSNVQMELAL